MPAVLNPATIFVVVSLVYLFVVGYFNKSWEFTILN